MDLVRRAAADNAAWCDLVCRSHGLDTALDADAWTSRRRTPPLYPDAVSLSPTAGSPGLLDRIDVSAGCSIKDSFATLELASSGFRVLFDAEWIVRSRAAPITTARRWEVVRDGGVFMRWERAWRGDDGPADVLRADLLDHEPVTVLAARAKDGFAAGAILHRSEEVLGLSNIFGSGDRDDVWAGCLALVDALAPGSVVVGYESGADLEVALNHGFEPAGPRRIWVHDG